jgi:hypothetical protein
MKATGSFLRMIETARAAAFVSLDSLVLVLLISGLNPGALT